MRRHLLLFLILGSIVLVVASAQAGQTPGQEPGKAPIALQHMVNGEYQALTLSLSAGPDPGRTLLDLNPATDTWEKAPVLGIPGGGTTTTNDMNEDLGDPALACMWGIPLRIQGWRTVWYQFIAANATNVTIDTAGSTYDTVLAVYSSQCDNGCSPLSQLVCNDDNHFFDSKVTFPVRQGETYYVEVADWQGPANGDLILTLSAWPSALDSAWQTVNTDRQISRHAAVVVGKRIYVIGGQTVVSGNPHRTPRTSVYDTQNGTWTDLTNMPGLDAYGYSNTTAVAIDGKIYLPSGYIGIDDQYDGTHYVFDTASGEWDTAATNTWAGGNPAIYSAAVAGPFPNFDKGYYLTGGLTGPLPGPDDTNWSARSEIYYYPKDYPVWFSALTEMSTGRFGHAAALQPIGIKGSICVTGGIGKDGDLKPVTLGSSECFDIDQGNWFSIAPLNFPRYFPGSAVDADQNWYVFGGVNADGKSIGVIERYNVTDDQWEVLDIKFDLSNPNRSWARGGFIGDNLWVVGGEADQFQVLSLMQKMKPPPAPVTVPVQEAAFMPAIMKAFIQGVPGQSFARARPLTLNQSQFHRFQDINSDVHVFTFDLSSIDSVTVKLTGIPLGSDYDLYVYSENKYYHSVGKGKNPGNQSEIIPLTLAAGRYYVVVERVFPVLGEQPSANKYEILVEG